ncbi:MAG: superoxide dismutase family protein [Hyphomonadaceae bacterium]
MRLLAALFLATVLAGCASSGGGGGDVVQAAPRTVWIVGPGGQAIGQATFTGGPSGTLIRLEFPERALPPGWHGLHLHDRGDCSDFAQGFQAAGGHLGMGRRISHGLLSDGGPEAGDLPSIFAPPVGPFAAEVFAPLTTLSSERIPANANRRERLALLDGDGTALVIHSAHDDQRTQPIGGAGERIACAALRPLP